MKHFKTICLICAVIFSFTACSSDDNDNTWGDQPDHSENYMEYNGTRFPLVFGVVEHFGTGEADDNSYQYALSFSTSDFSENEEGDLVPDDSILSLIGFNVYSSNGTQPEPGEYDFAEEEVINFTFEDGFGFINLNYDSISDGTDIEDMEFEQLISIKSGTIKILQSGDTYEVEMNLINYNNKPIAGYYKGELMEYTDDSNRPFLF